jgi:lipoprotein-releasing system permease protein
VSIFELLRHLSTRLAVSSGRRRFLSFAKAVAFTSVFLGSAAMVISLSVLAGFDAALHSLAESFTSHIQVRTRGYMPLGEKDALLRSIPAVSPDIVRVDEVISVNALLYAHGSTEGVIVKSLPKRLYAPTGAQADDRGNRRVVAGNAEISGLSDRDVAIGARLASRLSCSVGDTVLITTSSSDLQQYSSFDVLPVRIASIYESGMTQYDDIYVFAPFAFSRSIIDTLHSGAVYAEIWVKDRRMVSGIAASIAEQLRYAVECTTVDDLHRGMFSWIEIQKKPIPLVIALISIVAVFNVVTTLLISIVEKTASYAILQTLGLSRNAIISLVCWQGLRLGFAGSSAGCLFAFGILYAQKVFGLVRLDGAIYFVDTVPVVLDISHSILVIVIASGISLIATLIPGLIASRFSPVASFRFR